MQKIKIKKYMFSYFNGVILNGGLFIFLIFFIIVLLALSKVKSDDKEWFFFTCLELMKFNKSKPRFNRKTNIEPKPETKTKTEDGYWKITGKDREIKTNGTNIVIGIKKTLVYYDNQHEKTNWVMHEYHSTFPDNKVCVALFYFEKACVVL
jgi:hypothetical protein